MEEYITTAKGDRKLTWAGLVARFWTGVQKDCAGGCWLWTKGKHGAGYGECWNGKRPSLAHRFAYELLVGPIPEGLELDHLCRVRHCVNPAHLEPVTHRENARRGEGASGKNFRKTHCKRGHELSGDNLFNLSSGQRTCKACNHAVSSARYYRNKKPITEARRIYEKLWRERNKERIKEYRQASKLKKTQPN